MERRNTDKTYTVRELDMKFEQVKLFMEEKHEDNKVVLQEILTQTKTTNGRVNKLEKWQSYIQGGMAVIVMLFVPIVLYVLTHGLK